MKEKLHMDIHQDHRTWKSDLEMWTLDIRMWEEELKALNNSLVYIGQAVREHEEGLESHKLKLLEHKALINKHETDITYLPEGSRLDVELDVLHDKETANHANQAEVHERLKKFHHKIMVLTKELQKALEVID